MCLANRNWSVVEQFHHGDCVGADARAHYIAAAYGVRIVRHPPIDEKLWANMSGADETWPAKSYLERDRDIVDTCDLLVAAPREMQEEHRGGTWYTIHYARRIGKLVTIIWPDGSQTDEGTEVV